MKAIILAGGLGTRLQEETGVKPKPMVEISGQPMLWHIMKIYDSFGVDEFGVAMGYKANVIRNYFTNYYYHHCDMSINLRSGEITPTNGNSQCFEVEDRSYWFLHRNDCIITLLHRYPPSGKLLDIGGGNGYVAQRVLSEGFPVVLLEPGATGAWNAKHRRKILEVRIVNKDVFNKCLA